jgi:hypothetical protein
MIDERVERKWVEMVRFFLGITRTHILNKYFDLEPT